MHARRVIARLCARQTRSYSAFFFFFLGTNSMHRIRRAKIPSIAMYTYVYPSTYHICIYAFFASKHHICMCSHALAPWSSELIAPLGISKRMTIAKLSICRGGPGACTPSGSGALSKRASDANFSNNGCRCCSGAVFLVASCSNGVMPHITSCQLLWSSLSLLFGKFGKCCQSPIEKLLPQHQRIYTPFSAAITQRGFSTPWACFPGTG